MGCQHIPEELLRIIAYHMRFFLFSSSSLLLLLSLSSYLSLFFCLSLIFVTIVPTSSSIVRGLYEIHQKNIIHRFCIPSPHSYEFITFRFIDESAFRLGYPADRGSQKAHLKLLNFHRAVCTTTSSAVTHFKFYLLCIISYFHFPSV